MRQDWKFDQSDILLGQPTLPDDKIIVDPSLRGGICFAMSVNWCERMISGKEFNITADQYLMASSMRAYQSTWETQTRDLLDAAHYEAFMQVAETKSYRFFQDTFTRLRHACHRNEFRSVQAAAMAIGHLSGAALVGLFGVENGSNWGHAVGVARVTGWRFFDPNQGQFSMPKNTSGDLFAGEVAVNLSTKYQPDTVRTVVVYTAD